MSKQRKGDKAPEPTSTPSPVIREEEHPDHLDGWSGDDNSTPRSTPVPDGPIDPPFPPMGPFPPRGPFDPREPRLPIDRPWEPRLPIWPPIRLCGAVSGRFSSPIPVFGLPIAPTPGGAGLDLMAPRFTVRVDVDRYYPQRRISVSTSRKFPRATAHIIAEVTSDECIGLNHRVVRARVTYRDGDTGLIPEERLVFEAKRTKGKGYGEYTITFLGPTGTGTPHKLSFRSKYFDNVEFEYDTVSNAGTAVTSMDTAAHPNRPADLPAETISLSTVYQRAGFDVSLSPNTSTIPISDAGANGTWSDSEMHDAMIAYWSRFADRPQWAMWGLFAARHDMGYGLGGIMFDDIGPNHRQGTAMFTDSFIQDVPAGDPDPAAWRRRMAFWTMAHEMGHGFNLAHAWQKSLGNPWLPLADAPESRSFMNYPYNVSGGESAFFSDFRFRFSDDELIFMRHAPRRFVQMGNEDWFENHAFEAPEEGGIGQNWTLRVRPNKDRNSYSFLEPIAMELKLTNASARTLAVEEDLLRDGRHISVMVQRENGLSRPWRPLSATCHKPHKADLRPGISIYGAHTISITPAGWLVDEPGFYKVQAAVSVDGEVVVSNVLRLFVAPATSAEEARLAPDYFTEDVGRVLVFNGAPSLITANNTLQEVVERCAGNPAALHASMALSAPKLRTFKRLSVADDGRGLAIRSDDKDVETAAKTQKAALLDAPNASADTMGHIDYFGALDNLAESLATDGNTSEAKKVLGSSVEVMRKRKVLESVIKETERRIAQLK